MTPLVETLLIIVLAVFVLLVVCWAFRAFKNDKEELRIVEEPEEPLILNYEDLKKPEKKQAVQPGKANIVTGKTVSYEETPLYFKAKGKWFPVWKSSQGSMFIVTEEGPRRYLSAKEKESLQTLSDIS